MRRIWRCINHIATAGHHQALYREQESGVIREVHTTCRNGFPTGPSYECYWHPSEPQGVTHASLDEAIAATA